MKRLSKEQLLEMLNYVKDAIKTEDWDKVLKLINYMYPADEYQGFVTFLLGTYPEFTRKLTTIPADTFDYDTVNSDRFEELHFENVTFIDMAAFQNLIESKIYLSKNIKKIRNEGFYDCNYVNIIFDGDIQEWIEKAEGFGPWWFGDEQSGLVVIDSHGDKYLVADDYKEIQ